MWRHCVDCNEEAFIQFEEDQLLLVKLKQPIHSIDINHHVGQKEQHFFCPFFVAIGILNYQHIR